MSHYDQDERVLSKRLKPNSEHRAMQIFVINLRGKRITYEIKATDTVSSLKTKIKDIEGIVPCKQGLIYNGKLLEDSCTLSSYNIQKGSIIHMSMRFSGDVISQQQGQKPTTPEKEMIISVRDMTGYSKTVQLSELTYFRVKPSTKFTCVLTFMTRKLEGLPLHFLHLGLRFCFDKSMSENNIENGDEVIISNEQSGMISTFTRPQAESLDPLVQYLMLSEEERDQADIPIDLLKEKARQAKYNAFHTFQYIEKGEVLADEQFTLLSSFLDFMWNKTAIETNTDRVDMRLSIEMDTFEYLISIVDPLVPFVKVSDCVVMIFEKLFKDIPGAGGSAKVALRMTRGPTNACIDFHCDGLYATSTTQIALNDPSEYKGGQLCYFLNNKVHFLTRPKGSIVQHPPKVLHGVTNLREGTRKSLFILDKSNGLGQIGVVHVTEGHVNIFKAERMLKACSSHNM